MTELQKRKHPRLKSYDYSENGLYFLTICVKNREKLFGTVVGRDGTAYAQTLLSLCDISPMRGIPSTRRKPNFLKSEKSLRGISNQ